MSLLLGLHLHVCVCVFRIPRAQMAIWGDGEPVVDWGLILRYRRVWTC